MDYASSRSGLECKDESLARQSEAEDADINTIVRRFGLTGQLPDNIRLPQYGDFTNITSYHEAMNQVARAGEEFDKLPAAIRARFHNDPEEFVEFCSDKQNEDELEKLGLLNDAALARRAEARQPKKEADTPPPAPKTGAVT